MFDATILTLQRALDLRMKAHEIHTSNLANANVPDFKARKIDFEDRMRDALTTLEGGAEPILAKDRDAQARLKNVEADVYEDPLAVPSGDGNTVNVEREQTEIAKNTIAYEGAVQMISKKFALQKYILSEAGR